MPPLISIIMPCHNAAAHLPSSVKSVLVQTFSDWELIAVDDGSVDDTLKWLKAQTDPRIHAHHQTNQGVSAARNAGLALAQGDYVAFLDSDDTWAPDFLALMRMALADRPDTVLVYSGWQNVGMPGKRGQPFVPPDYETANKVETLFAKCRWPIHAALVKRSAVMAAGGFNPRLKNAEDFALWLEVATTAPIVRVPQVLAYYHFHGAPQASANRSRTALHRLDAQLDYLMRHPEFEARLGKRRIRKLLYGELLSRGYESYWNRDLPAVRQIFRMVMKQGYGSLRDWKYMLPALLPEAWHKELIVRLEKGKNRTDGQL
jgi:glycosyltransferase involved in cell wall biosynthesis